MERALPVHQPEAQDACFLDVSPGIEHTHVHRGPQLRSHSGMAFAPTALLQAASAMAKAAFAFLSAAFALTLYLKHRARALAAEASRSWGETEGRHH